MPALIPKSTKDNTYLPAIDGFMNGGSSTININIRYDLAVARNVLWNEAGGKYGVIVVFYTPISKWNNLGYSIPNEFIYVDSEWIEATYPGFESAEGIKLGIEHAAVNCASPLPTKKIFCRWVAVITDRQQGNYP